MTLPQQACHEVGSAPVVILREPRAATPVRHPERSEGSLSLSRSKP
jgi:hypothetical protein